MPLSWLYLAIVACSSHVVSSYIGTKRPVATGVNRFLSVFGISSDPETGNRKSLRTGATATDGPVAIGPVGFGFGLFSGPSNWTLKHYSVISCR
jgi:hypothetical protein